MPRTRYTHTVALENISTPRLVITELEKLDSLLAKSELFQISFFNRAYLIITKTINSSNDAGYFASPALMNELEVNFAKHYFKALNHYAQTGALPGKWHRINAGWLHKKHPASLSLMLGAHAHIKDDLLPSLKKIISEPEKFRGDYFKVNTLLLESAKAISKSYYEEDEHINFLKKLLRPIYLKPVMLVIIRWRTHVWRQLEHKKL